MAVEFEKLSFTKDWKNASDFPTYEENETQVRADMQALHDETRDFINGKLIPGIENMAVPGAGDMLMDVYDTTGRREDVYAYATARADAAKEQAKADINDHLMELEKTVSVTPGPITLFREFKTAGTYTVKLPEDAVVVYALAVGAGGGGGRGSNVDPATSGSGGNGGSILFCGPILIGSISDLNVVVGAGGTTGVDGGASSVFGLTASGGKGGGNRYVVEQTDPGTGEIVGAVGGAGSISGVQGGSAGTASGVKIPFTLLSYSAGGGGGSAKDGESGGAGGVCSIGSGGRGGGRAENGSNGGQCCGGGGAGLTYSSETRRSGGKGGDGYVAIWVQRSGITE